MRKLFSCFVLFFAILCLSSCESIHRRNYFVEGEFSGFNVYNTDEKYYLSVLEISQEEYETAQGVNVVHDIYKKKYYALDLYFLVGQSDEKNDIDFINLKDAMGVPLGYEDDNGKYLLSFCRDYDHTEKDIEKNDSAYYKIEIPFKDNYGLSAYVNFYKGEN